MRKQEEKKSSTTKNSLNIRPLGDRVLVRDFENQDKLEKTEGGIYIPDTVKEDRGSKKAEVVAVGPGKYDDGEIVPMTVKVGDTVLYSWGDTVKIGDAEYVMVSESNILAIIK